jgi:NAD(P)-dependent dehydrogenase (short-subunit alcohol dehydrogenase family)
MAQVWLVTGSSRGLGRAIVEAGLTAGNKVLATARDIKSLADLSERFGDQVKLFAMDVTDEAAAANAVMAAVDIFGSLDVVINNAGYGNLSSVEDTPLSEFRAQIETNLFGTIIVTKAALKYIDRRHYRVCCCCFVGHIHCEELDLISKSFRQISQRLKSSVSGMTSCKS